MENCLAVSINAFNSGTALAGLYNKYIHHKTLIIRMFTVPSFVIASNCKQRQTPNSKRDTGALTQYAIKYYIMQW